MALLDLHTLVSTEDFADAHEPLNDGVKEIPNAQTVAASTKTADVGTDTTTAGPAKVIPEKNDTDDVTKTEHNVVKESAEKNESKPTKAPAPAESAKVEEDAGNDTEPDPDTTKSDTPGADTEPKEPLAHDNEKDTRAELKKTEEVKTALEAYAPRAKTFDLIGHPKVQSAHIEKLVTYTHRVAGQAAPTKVSLESVNSAIELSQKRIAKLESDLTRFDKVSNESIVEETIVTEQPTETGGELLPPPVAEGITELETDPLDVPILEIDRVKETIDALTKSAVAVEKYIEIVRANPRMSKQAAAVLHAGLEHIDRVCELKVRSTGMEGYLTTPRAAMEEAEVKEKSLLDRAGEIGAKLLKLIMELIERVKVLVQKYTSGLKSREDEVRDLVSKAKARKEDLPEIRLEKVYNGLLMDGEFVGDYLTDAEKQIPKLFNDNRRQIMVNVFKPLLAILSKGPASEEMIQDIDDLVRDTNTFTERTSKLPGGFIVRVSGLSSKVEHDYDGATRSNIDLDLPAMSKNEAVKNLSAVADYIGTLADTAVAMDMSRDGEALKKSIIALRKASNGDEANFQKVQNIVMGIIRDAFDPKVYFQTLWTLAHAQWARLYYYKARLAN